MKTPLATQSSLLIVDDDDVVRNVLARLLEEQGRTTFAVATGAEALAVLQKGPIDVALVDKNLVGESGLDVSRALKDLQPDLEIILLTAYASLESAIEAVQIGAYDYLTKPVEDFAQLRRRVRLAQERGALKRGQKLLLDKLTESETRFRMLVESTPDALLLADAQTGKVVDANPAATALYRTELSKLAGMSLSDLGIESTSAEPVIEVHQRGDGSTFTAETRSVQVVVHDAATRAVSVRDVSERQALEERVRLSQKMEAVGRLAGGVAHDFNNLLTVILSHGDFLEPELQPGSPAAVELQGIQKAAQRAAALTRQLLLFSRRKRAETGVVDVNAVVAEVRKLLDRVIGERVQVRLDSAPGLHQVRADSDQLAQVLLNLMVNARDAMPRGGEVAIATANEQITGRRQLRAGELLPGEYVRLTVADQGHGMPPAVQARLFEPFFTTKELGHGTGLGLATVYGIVQGAGGAIDVQSEEGHGATFTVYLPATTAEAKAMPEPQAPAPSARGETVLLVEDEEPLRELLARALRAKGYEVLPAADGSQGLQLARDRTGRLDLLITDVVMPHLSGVELALALLRERPALRVLYMTGYSEASVPPPGESTSFLQKPFAAQALLAEARRLLDR